MTGERFHFRVPTRPVPKARPRLSRSGHAYTSARTVKFEMDVLQQATLAGVELRDDRAYKVELLISNEYADVFITDVGKIKKKMRGDLDNYCKSLLDGINRLDGWDDGQVVELQAVKHWTCEREDES